ncbi:MAG: serine/threonine protein kinase [Deltaproteobacteria bacterium]|nr:serine/threonine protein kinase [Deltaproteobacteria bacterium]
MTSALPPPLPSAAASSGPDEVLPRKFGKYTLMRKLATGGMAELYLAIHRSISGFEKLVVIKQILPRFTADPEFVQMFMDEARIAATLSHPNIIQIFDVGAVGDRYFIAMEFIHGEDVRSIVRGMVARQMREFPLEHALSITIGICAGLDYAHSRKGFSGEDLNIVHRDISPQNILVTFTGDVKLVDFGIAKAALKSRSEGRAGAGKTDEGQLRGKFPYMSPEQCRGLSLDHRSDIFSLGIVLFELTTGRRLFRGKSEVDTIRRIVEDPYPQPMKVRPGYPPALEPIVMRALARERDARYGSARELQADLERFVRDERVPVSSIALSNFMHELFADKLAAQRQAMAEGKQLADVIASETDGEEIRFDDVADTAVTGRTAGPRSTTRSMVVVQPKRSRAGLWAGLALLCAALVGGGLWFALGRGGGESAAPVDAGPPPAPDVAAVEPEVEPERDTFVAAVDTAPPPQVVKGTLLFTGVPPGMKVFLDDQFALENRNPAAGDFPISRVVAGDHILRLDHPEYVADEFSIGLPEDRLGPVGTYGDGWTVDLAANYIRPLAEGEVWLTLTLMEPGAELKINDEGPVAYQPEVELRRRTKLVDGEIRIEVTKRFYEAFRRTFRPLRGQPDQVAIEAPIALARSAGSGPRDAGGSTPPPPSGVGRLAVRCDPYATVAIPGHGTRGTPFSIELPSGTYRLVFANPDQGLSSSRTVTITPGGNAKVTDCW